MRWAKVLMIAVGALIAFIVLESVFRLLQWAVIALVIGVIIAVAVKAHSQYRLARERRAQVREEKAERKSKVTGARARARGRGRTGVGHPGRHAAPPRERGG